MTEPDRAGSGGALAAWAQVLRLPNLFTVPGDALAGLALASDGLPGAAAWAAGGAVLLIYCGGLLINDYFDREEDARDRPDRPLPSGRVRPGHVLATGLAALCAGAALAFAAGGVWPGVVAALTAVVALAYDARLRRTRFGIWCMGACRAGSVLTGAAFAATLPLTVWIAALTALAYTAALSGVARDETTGAAPGRPAYLPAAALVAGAAGMVIVQPAAWPALCMAALAAAESFYAARLAVQRSVAVPPTIGRLVRVMLWTQAAWFLWPMAAGGAAAVVMLAAYVLRVGAELAAREFYGS